MVAAESVFVRINKKERIERPDWKQAAEAICRNSWMRGRQKQHLRANKDFELQTFLGDNHSNSNCFGLQTVKPKVIWIANIQAQANVGCRRSNSFHFGLQTIKLNYFEWQTFKLNLFCFADVQNRPVWSCRKPRAKYEITRNCVRCCANKQPVQEATGQQATDE